MPTTRLSRSVPFWVLVGGSAVAIAGGAYLLITKLTLMAETLTDGTATGVEVYAGQIWAVLGAILIGVGLIGLALALTAATLHTRTAEVPAPFWTGEEPAVTTAVAETVTPAETVTQAEPVNLDVAETTALDAEAGVETPAPGTLRSR